MKHLLLVLSLGATGCLSTPHRAASPLRGEVVPPNPALVQSCLSTQKWHNLWMLLGAGAAGSAGITAATDTAVTNKNVENGINIGAAFVAAGAGVAAVAAGMEANTYSQNNCANILSQAASAGTLPP